MIGELKKGKELIKKSAEGRSSKGGRYTSFISWKPDETKLLYFVTPIAEVPRVMMHNFVRKYVENEDGSTRETWMTFMCRKDAAWLEESGGECTLCDEIGHVAQERFAAVAVELEPVMDGKRITGVEVKYKAGTDSEGKAVQYPQVGLVVQGAGNFFHTLTALDDRRPVDDISWEITREGQKLDTKYIFYPVEHEPNLSSIKDSIPSLLDVLSNLGSAERYERELEGVSAADQPSYDTPKKRKASSDEGTDDIFSQMKQDLLAKSGEKLESY